MEIKFEELDWWVLGGLIIMYCIGFISGKFLQKMDNKKIRLDKWGVTIAMTKEEANDLLKDLKNLCPKFGTSLATKWLTHTLRETLK